MFTWVIKKWLNLTLKVIFLCQKSFESFWFFLLKNINLEEDFLLLLFFEKFNFWTTLFSKLVPNFWLSIWTSVKVKSKNYFHFTDFLLISNSCPQNSTTEVTLILFNKIPPTQFKFIQVSSRLFFKNWVFPDLILILSG